MFAGYTYFIVKTGGKTNVRASEDLLPGRLQYVTTGGQEDCHYRIRQPGTCTRTEPARFRNGCCSRSISGIKVEGKGRSTGPDRQNCSGSRQGCRCGYGSDPGREAGTVLQDRHRAEPQEWFHVDVRSRIQHSLRSHQAGC